MTAEPTVFVVDDDSILRTIVEIKLKGRGFRVISTAESEQAVSLIQKERPDVIVLDAMMPGTDGFEILRQLKADKALAAIPVVMLSARRQESDIVSALKAGASDYLVKPFIPDELAVRIQRLLPRQAA